MHRLRNVRMRSKTDDEGRDTTMSAPKRARRRTQPTMGRPVGSDSTRTRQRILRDALAVFVELGYGKATHEAVAKRAEISRSLLYRYYESKRVLYANVLEWIQEALRERTVEAGYRSTGTAFERLSSSFLAGAQVHREDPNFSRILIASLVDGLREPEFADIIEAWVADLRQIYESAVAQAAADGQLNPGDDPKTVIDLLNASLWGLALFGAFMGTPDEVVDAIHLFNRRVLPALIAEGS
ncbi:transcriptional regulator, TetR family [Mycolicibacterium rhodesiae JS60]|nr:transcriptional regulator, TetR family [Mycolicibacterium rhodesiae JS60]